MEFFYRFEGLDLIPGNKTAGFAMTVSTSAIERLLRMQVGADAQNRVIEQARERLLRAQLFSQRVAKDAGIWFYEDTACPRVFGMLGASIGFNPEVPGWLLRDPEMALGLGLGVEYTPHNMDAPKQALGVMLIAQTWAEWAGLRLWAAKRDTEAQAQAK